MHPDEAGSFGDRGRAPQRGCNVWQWTDADE